MAPNTALARKGTGPLIGYAEIAAMAGVEVDTARTWRRRNMLPAPAARQQNQPKWYASQITQWFTSTGRAYRPLKEATRR